MPIDTLLRVFLICIAFLGTLILLPVILLIFAVGYLYRLVVQYLLKLKHGNTVELMNGVDAVWAEDNPRWRSIITSLLILEGKPDINEFRSRVLKLRTPENPKLFQSRHWERGYYYWKTIPRYLFKIEDHIKYAPMKEATEDELMTYISSISTAPLGEKINSPSWEVIVGPEIIQKGQPEGKKKFAIITRCHHCIGYGNALLKIFACVADSPIEFRGMAKPMVYTWIDTVKSLLKVIAGIIYGPFCVLDQLLRYDDNALYGPELSGTRTLVWSKVGTIDACKKIRNRTRINVNDTIISSVSSSLSTLLKPSDSFVTSIIPALVILPGLSSTSSTDEFVLLNSVTAGLLTIPTPPPATDPFTRLCQVHDACNAVRTSPSLLVNYFLASIIWSVLPSPIAKLMLSATRFTLILSNLPGPEKAVSLCGQNVEDLIFWLPCRCTTGVCIALISYGGTIRAGVSVDCAILPVKNDVQKLADGMAKALENLLDPA